MLRADFDRFARALYQLRDGFRAMASGEMQEEMLRDMSARGTELIQEGFAEQRAPDGNPWRPAARDYGHPLLNASGDMLGSAECTPGPRDDGQGFQLTFAVQDAKAIWHQFGTFRGGPTSSALRAQNRKSFRSGGRGSERQHIPARKMIFNQGETPDRWINELTKVAQASAERWLSARFKV